MSSYRVLVPCVVRQADAGSAVHYRKVGAVVTVGNKIDAELLVKGGFLEPVAEPKAAAAPPPQPPEKPKP